MVADVTVGAAVHGDALSVTDILQTGHRNGLDDDALRAEFYDCGIDREGLAFDEFAAFKRKQAADEEADARYRLSRERSEDPGDKAKPTEAELWADYQAIGFKPGELTFEEYKQHRRIVD